VKLKELITKYAWAEIRSALLRLYPDQEKSIAGYQHVYDMLLRLSAKPTPMAIMIEKYTDDFTDTPYDTVSGRDETGSYGIEFTDWSEWLGMDIDASTLAAYPELDIIAHCLWEMTFFGYSQEDIHKQLADFEHRRTSEKRLTLDEVKQALDLE